MSTTEFVFNLSMSHRARSRLCVCVRARARWVRGGEGALKERKRHDGPKKKPGYGSHFVQRKCLSSKKDIMLSVAEVL